MTTSIFNQLEAAYQVQSFLRGYGLPHVEIKQPVISDESYWFFVHMGEVAMSICSDCIFIQINGDRLHSLTIEGAIEILEQHFDRDSLAA